MEYWAYENWRAHGHRATNTCWRVWILQSRQRAKWRRGDSQRKVARSVCSTPRGSGGCEACQYVEGLRKLYAAVKAALCLPDSLALGAFNEVPVVALP